MVVFFFNLTSIFSFIDFSSNVFSHHIHKHSMLLHSLFHCYLLLHYLYICSLLLYFLYTLLVHDHIHIQYSLITLHMLCSLKNPLLSSSSLSNYYSLHKNNSSIAFIIDIHVTIHHHLLFIDIYNYYCIE